MSSHRINAELSETLIVNNGLKISSEQLEELFNQENIDKDKETGQSRSNVSLFDGMGGTEKLISDLKSDAKMGIEATPEDINARKAQYGSNERHKRAVQTICEMICAVFDDFILKVLIAAAIVSMAIGIYNEGLETGWIEGTSILVAIVIITVVTVSNDYSRQAQFLAIMEKDDVKTARVIRGGNQMTIDTQELVVGDVLVISTGDMIPADAIVFQTHEMNASEASLTGEPHAKSKEPLTADNYPSCPTPYVLQGSLIEQGSGKAVVCAVGNRTQQGKAGLSMTMEQDQTPLQAKLETIANTIGKFGTYVAVLTFIAITIRTLCLVFLKHEREFMDSQNLDDILEGFIIGVTIIVVAVPEGLPLAVAIALKAASGKMEAENNLVRKMESAETMGNANEICTDKTGTLTQNKMTVMEGFFENGVQEGTTNGRLKSLSTGELIAHAICFNSSAFIETSETGQKKTKGNVTEVGIIDYLIRAGFNCEEMIDHREQNLEQLFTIPFSSIRKRSTNVIRHPYQPGMVRVFLKGAPDMCLPLCERIIDTDGSAVDLSEDDKQRILGTEVLGTFAQKCYRTILMAYVDYTESEWESLKDENNQFATGEDREHIEKNLTLIGIFALMDPLREGIADTVDIMHDAGINVRMCTGDFIDTAVAISKQAHILSHEDMVDNEGNKKQYACMTGEDFRRMINGKIELVEDKPTAVIGNMKAFRDIYPQLKVLARSAPNDKLLLVHGLMHEGKTVAVTGDGTNDAPALIRANIGFAMGITGTEKAIDAADIKLLDDNFCSIKTAVRYGRNIYDNVRKFLQFQLTVNVVALFIVFFGSIIFEETPLNAVQMLWVNLIMDTLASLALATEPPTEGIMKRKPSKKTDKIVNEVMWRNILGHSIYQIALLMLLLFFGRDWFGLPYENSFPLYATDDWLAAQTPEDVVTYGLVLNEATNKCHMYTIVFQAFVMMQVFNMVNARKLLNTELNVFSDFFNNGRFLFILLLIIGVQLALVQYGGRAFKCTPLTTVQQAICVACGAFTLIWAVLIKLVLKPEWFMWINFDEDEMDDKEESQSFQAQLRRSYRQSRTMRASSRVSNRPKEGE